jgi:glycosyltransferase involved in cell wall biosynthesis
MRSPQGSLRVFPQVRSILIDDLNAESPRPTLFIELYYEAASRTLPADWEQVTRLEALRRLWQAPPETLELFEPLWFAHFPFWVALAAAHRIRTAGSRAQRAFFAIENNDLELIVPRGTRLGGLPTAIVKLILRLLIPLLVNRVAYGSEAAAALYSPFVGSRAETTLIPLVRAPRITWTPAKPVGTVAFVGVLHERKGLPLLLRAWELVEQDVPDAHLTIIGDGPLAADVTQWVSEKPETRTFLGQVSRTDVIMLLTNVSVIAIPSQRWLSWREQINGALQEGLSVGCTVVTTTETGLAPWLQAQGHTVVDPGVSAAELAASIVSAIRAPLDAGTVIGSLPKRDGRVLADLWLHSTGTAQPNV